MPIRPPRRDADSAWRCASAASSSISRAAITRCLATNSWFSGREGLELVARDPVEVLVLDVVRQVRIDVILAHRARVEGVAILFRLELAGVLVTACRRSPTRPQALVVTTTCRVRRSAVSARRPRAARGCAIPARLPLACRLPVPRGSRGTVAARLPLARQASRPALVAPGRPCAASTRAPACRRARVAPRRRRAASTRVRACRHDLVELDRQCVASTHVRACRRGWACRRELGVRRRPACAHLEERRRRLGRAGRSLPSRSPPGRPPVGRDPLGRCRSGTFAVGAAILRFVGVAHVISWIVARVIRDLTQNGHPNESGGHFHKEVRRCPTLPQSLPCSTIGAESLSFRVRNVTGRFPLAMAAETLLIYAISFWPVSSRHALRENLPKA